MHTGFLLVLRINVLICHKGLRMFEFSFYSGPSGFEVSGSGLSWLRRTSLLHACLGQLQAYLRTEGWAFELLNVEAGKIFQ